MNAVLQFTILIALELISLFAIYGAWGRFVNKHWPKAIEGREYTLNMPCGGEVSVVFSLAGTFLAALQQLAIWFVWQYLLVPSTFLGSSPFNLISGLPTGKEWDINATFDVAFMFFVALSWLALVYRSTGINGHHQNEVQPVPSVGCTG